MAAFDRHFGEDARRYLYRLLVVILCGMSWIYPHVHAQGLHDRNRPNPQLKTSDSSRDYPHWDAAHHDIGNIRTCVTNRDNFVWAWFVEEEGVDVWFEYPKGSHQNYLETGEVWVGGVIGKDTLVSTGYRGHGLSAEFCPDAGEQGAIQIRSILRSSPYWHGEAISEQDYVCEYTDTITDPEIIGEDWHEDFPHKPLNIRVRQASYAWSAEYAEDFVLYDFRVDNIGNAPIRDMYIGVVVFPRVWFLGDTSAYMVEDHNLTGFLPAVDLPPGRCREQDSLRIFWSADDDGEPDASGFWNYASLRSVVGLQLLRPGFDEKTINYNWWEGRQGEPEYDWGPRRAPTNDDPWREIGWGLGYPEHDVDRYYVLSHPEFDYDQMFTAVDHTHEGFLPPPPPRIAADVANGAHNEYMVSFGPYDLAPGDSVPFTFAMVAGENFHVNPSDFENYFNPYRPEEYYSKLNFSDLAENSRWVRWIYDNPGVDTDGDGYSGESCWRFIWRPNPDIPGDSIVVDSFRYFYTGDGVPDFKAMTPPLPPTVRTIPENGRITIRWNGQESETTPDLFSGVADFEGYRVYMARDDRLADFVLLASYDMDDYQVFEFDEISRMWEKTSNAARHDSLKTLYGDMFDANEYYDEYHAFRDPHTNRYKYYVRQDWNQSDLSDPLKIHKVYPEASRYDSSDLTEEGWRRYYEYEHTIDNLQPSVPYYVAVTAFDYGSFQYDIGQLETSPTTNAVREFALPSSDDVEERGLSVIVYPNPYRIDDGYARAGYENRDRTKSAERSRRVHFANLPRVCKIRIYTIDGDLVRELDHYYPEGGPSSQHEEWNLISRNTQAVVTGIYLWHVRSEMGDQVGKLVIMK